VAAWRCRTNKGRETDLNPTARWIGDTYTFRSANEKDQPGNEIIAVSIVVKGSDDDFRLVSLKMSLRRSYTLWKDLVGRFKISTA
jgi:hypothetical protein